MGNLSYVYARWGMLGLNNEKKAKLRLKYVEADGRLYILFLTKTPL